MQIGPAASRELLVVREVVRAEAGHQVGTVGYLRSSLARLTSFPAALSFRSNCANLERPRSTAYGSACKQDSSRLTRRKTSKRVARRWTNQTPPRRPCLTAAIPRCGKVTWPCHHGSAQRGGSGLPGNCEDCADGNDLRSQSRRNKSLPKEFTSWQDVANGAEVLYHAVLLLDDRLNRK